MRSESLLSTTVRTQVFRTRLVFYLGRCGGVEAVSIMIRLFAIKRQGAPIRSGERQVRRLRNPFTISYHDMVTFKGSTVTRHMSRAVFMAKRLGGWGLCFAHVRFFAPTF
jgi:hypothetical protein